MKTEQELNNDILRITNTIHEKYPELSKYIEEMPVTIPDKASPEITIKTLQDYYNSLDALMKKYAPNHSEIVI